MKVGITTFGGDGGRSGIGRYMCQLLEALPVAFPQHGFEVITHHDEVATFCGDPPLLPAHTISPALRPPARSIAWHQTALPFTCWRRGYDVLFLPAGNRRLPAWVPCPTVGTVHDFSSLHVDGKYDRARTFYIKEVLPRLVRGLTEVITVSESSKADILSVTGMDAERVHVIPLGVDADRFKAASSPAAKQAARQRAGRSRPYILYVSRLEHPGKNHVGLIAAFDRFKAATGAPHELVLAGSDWNRAEVIHEAAAGARFSESITFTGFMPGEALPDLYAGADVFAFPSLYEGFGLPVLEAMASGVPVVCSNVSSIPEVAGNAAILVEPKDVGAWASALGAVVTDEGLRGRLVSRGHEQQARFRWERVASQTMEVLRRAGDAARGWAGKEIVI